MDINKQNTALKQKVEHAMQLLDWVSERISKASYQAYSENTDIGKTKAWQELDDAMRDGFLASYHEEFLYRDMNDEEIFGKTFCKKAWDDYYDKKEVAA